MSIQAMSWALKQNVKPAAAKLLLVAICNYADENGQAWPSKQRLARDCSTGKSNICKHIRVLVEMGLLSVRERRSQGASLTSIMTLNLDGVAGDTLGGSGCRGTVVRGGHKPSSEPSVVKYPSQGFDSGSSSTGGSRTNRSSRKGGVRFDHGSIDTIDIDEVL